MAKVKICGNRSAEDVRTAIELGVDYIGMIFAPGKRKVSIEEAKAICNVSKTFEGYVGVFLNQPKEEVLEIAQTLNLKFLQFHGDETAFYCKYFSDLKYKVIKTFHIKDQMSLKRIDEYSDLYAFLFDTYSLDRKGGTGKTFDWSLIEDKPYLTERLFLAGGLSVDNLENALVQVSPFAVDVSSGVEIAPGQKDSSLMKTFIQIAKKGNGSDVIKTSLR